MGTATKHCQDSLKMGLFHLEKKAKEKNYLIESNSA